MRPLVLAITAFVLLVGITAVVLVLTPPAAGPVPAVWVVYAGDPGNPYIDAARAGLLEASRNGTFTYEEFAPATADQLEAALADDASAPPKTDRGPGFGDMGRRSGSLGGSLPRDPIRRDRR